MLRPVPAPCAPGWPFNGLLSSRIPFCGHPEEGPTTPTVPAPYDTGSLVLQMHFTFSQEVVLLFDFWNVHSPAGKNWETCRLGLLLPPGSGELGFSLSVGDSSGKNLAFVTPFAITTLQIAKDQLLTVVLAKGVFPSIAGEGTEVWRLEDACVGLCNKEASEPQLDQGHLASPGISFIQVLCQAQLRSPL